MTKDDVLYLHKTITRGMMINMKDPKWITAFEEYNKNRPKPLQLHCRKCYTDVLRYHLTNIIKIEPNES